METQLKKKQNRPLEQSPFFRLKSRKKLAVLLNSSLPELEKFTLDSNYKLKERGSAKKPRPVQDPVFDLKKIHKRITKLLMRTAVPDYLKSGIKRSSNI